MRKKVNSKRGRTGLSAGLLVFLFACGCTWDSELFDEYESAVSGGEACAYPISSIRLDGGKVTITCPTRSSDVCEAADIVVEGKGSASEYASVRHNFNHQTCPAGLKCYNDTFKAGYQYCATASCEKGQHLFNGTCEVDDSFNCGSHGYNCSENVPNWASGTCLVGQCYAEACGTGYKAVGGICTPVCNPGQHYDNRVVKCVDDDNDNCGQTGHACLDEIKNSIDVACVDGSCKVWACADGYNIKENACSSKCSVEQHYDSNEGGCVANSVTDCGQTGYHCAEKVAHWADGTCQAGECIVTECADGFVASGKLCIANCGANQHYDNLTGACVADDIDNCGQTGYACRSQIKNSAAVDCVDGTCVVKSCNAGYTVSNNVCASSCSSEQHYDSTQSKCVDNTLKDCGQTGYACASKVPYWLDGSCTNGECVVSSCSSGYHVVNNACMPSCSSDQYYSTSQAACVTSDIDNCGHEGNSCKALPGWSDGDCSNSKCVATECKDPYQLDPSTGMCVAKYVCPPGSHSYNGNCEADTVADCGEHAKDCANVVEGWKAGSCLGGTCVVQACKDGYNYNMGACVAQTVTDECSDGQYLLDGKCVDCGCNSDGALSSTCNASGVCSCKTGVKGDKCDQCDNDNNYTNCSGDDSVLKCLKPSASGWTGKHSFSAFCSSECASCVTGQVCNRITKTNPVTFKCTGLINYE